MNKFFVGEKIYKKRITICKGCTHYFKLTGSCKICKCFMKIKARIGVEECPKKFWLKTTEMKAPDELPQELIDEILDLWKDLKTGRAKDQDAKKKMIELWNVISGSNYNPGTNCGSCISSSFDGIKKLYNKYNDESKNVLP